MVVEQDTVVEINSTSVADYGFYIKVKNTSSEDLEVYVRRAYANPTCAYDSGYFCWDFCYGAEVDNSIGYVAIDAGMEKKRFQWTRVFTVYECYLRGFYTLCVLQWKGC
jgi:hypothetical protein